MNDIATQTKHALNFVKKLHFEISFFIKEIEGLLLEEKERFTILKPGGYSVTSRTSSGLDSAGVEFWMPKDFTVFFCTEEFTDSTKGTTTTKFQEGLKILFMHIRLSNHNIDEPKIFFGVLYDIKTKKEDIKKFENIVWEFSYFASKVLNQKQKINFEDNNCSFKGKYLQKNLLLIQSSSDVKKRIVEPLIKIFNDIKT